MSYAPHSIPSGTSFLSHAVTEGPIPENKAWKIALAVVPIVGAFVEAANRGSLGQKLCMQDLRSRQIERIETAKKYCLAGIARNALWIAAAVSAVALGVLSHPLAIGILVGLPAYSISMNLGVIFKLRNAQFTSV